MNSFISRNCLVAGLVAGMAFACLSDGLPVAVAGDRVVDDGGVGETAVGAESIAESVDAAAGTASAGRMSYNNGKSEQENAREARRKGSLLPYGRVLKKLAGAVPGNILKVRLQQRDSGIWAYDFTVLDADGRYVAVSLNAATGEIIGKRVR